MKHKNEFKYGLWSYSGDSYIFCQLSTNKWRIRLSEVKGHVHVAIRGPDGYRKQGLSNVKSDLSQFESKVAALYFYRGARELAQAGIRHGMFEHTNYADIFGSIFD